MTGHDNTEQPDQDTLTQLREAAEALERSSQQLAETIAEAALRDGDA